MPYGHAAARPQQSEPSTPAPRIALVTGGSSGIGRAVVTGLATRGIDSVFTYRSGETQARETAATVAELGRTAVALHLDAGRSSTFDTFVDHLLSTVEQTWQRTDIDFLVNNAGASGGGSVAETTEEQFDQVMAVNFQGVFFLTQKVMPHIANGGRIINVSSTSSRVVGPSNVYGSSKAALEVFTRYLASELGPRGITVNAVAPGATVTNLGGGYLANNPDVAAALGTRSALGRVGRPEDPGATIAALLAAEPNWINGQRFEANGGQDL